jgi:hypothetical protein
VDAVVIAQQVPFETYITDLIRTDDNGSDEGTSGDTDEDTGEDEDDDATDSVRISLFHLRPVCPQAILETESVQQASLKW